MPVIRLTTPIAAPPERVFDLARSIDLHAASMAEHGEVAIAGVTHGPIGAGEEVTWRARHFGIWFELTARIVRFEPPRHFRDSMVRGVFARFDHDHFFERTPDNATLMRDVFDYTSPLGPLGRLADALFLRRYMTALLVTRNRSLKQAAESAGNTAATFSLSGPSGLPNQRHA